MHINTDTMLIFLSIVDVKSFLLRTAKYSRSLVSFWLVPTTITAQSDQILKFFKSLPLPTLLDEFVADRWINVMYNGEKCGSRENSHPQHFCHRRAFPTSLVSSESILQEEHSAHICLKGRGA